MQASQEKNKIKAIIFDAGGVIIDTSGIYRRIAEAFKPKDPVKFRHYINLSAVELSKGVITDKQYWDEIIREYGKPVSKERMYSL